MCRTALRTGRNKDEKTYQAIRSTCMLHKQHHRKNPLSGFPLTTQIVPFSHFAADVLEPGPVTSVPHKITRYMASLYLFRDSFQTFRRILLQYTKYFNVTRRQQLNELFHSRSTFISLRVHGQLQHSEFELSAAKTKSHILSVLQACIDVYFSQNWSHAQQIYEINRRYSTLCQPERFERTCGKLNASNVTKAYILENLIPSPVFKVKGGYTLIYFFSRLIPTSLEITIKQIHPLELRGVEIISLDAVQHPHLLAELHVKRLPSLILISHGKRITSFSSLTWNLNEITRWLEKGGIIPGKTIEGTNNLIRTPYFHLPKVILLKVFTDDPHMRQTNPTLPLHLYQKIKAHRGKIPMAIFLGGGIASGKSRRCGHTMPFSSLEHLS